MQEQTSSDFLFYEDEDHVECCVPLSALAAAGYVRELELIAGMPDTDFEVDAEESQPERTGLELARHLDVVAEALVQRALRVAARGDRPRAAEDYAKAAVYWYEAERACLEHVAELEGRYRPGFGWVSAKKLDTVEALIEEANREADLRRQEGQHHA